VQVAVGDPRQVRQVRRVLDAVAGDEPRCCHQQDVVIGQLAAAQVRIHQGAEAHHQVEPLRNQVTQ
jgi:hypothetical protein